MRLPDLHSRLHTLTKADNLGPGLIAVGIALINASLVMTIKLFLILLIEAAATLSIAAALILA